MLAVLLLTVEKDDDDAYAYAWVAGRSRGGIHTERNAEEGVSPLT